MTDYWVPRSSNLCPGESIPIFRIIARINRNETPEYNGTGGNYWPSGDNADQRGLPGNAFHLRIPISGGPRGFRVVGKLIGVPSTI